MVGKQNGSSSSDAEESTIVEQNDEAVCEGASCFVSEFVENLLQGVKQGSRPITSRLVNLLAAVSC